MEQDPREFLEKSLRNFPVMRKHLPMTPGGRQQRSRRDYVVTLTNTEIAVPDLVMCSVG